MAVLCTSFASHAEAAEAVGAVLEAGIPGADVRVLTGEPRRDARHEIKGLLTEAGLDEATAQRDLEAVHAGRVLVLVEAPEGETERVSRALGT